MMDQYKWGVKNACRKGGEAERRVDQRRGESTEMTCVRVRVSS